MQMSDKPSLDKIMINTCQVGACFVWLGPFFKRPKNKAHLPVYPMIKGQRGNRFVWSLVNGPIPEGKWILHTCDNSKCINPQHLYAGTPKDNVKDAYDRKRARNAKTTHCPKGHEYSDENTAIRKGKRYCKPCERIANKARYK